MADHPTKRHERGGGGQVDGGEVGLQAVDGREVYILIAISLKRIADMLDSIDETLESIDETLGSIADEQREFFNKEDRK